MPFVTKCYRCGWIVWAVDKAILKICMLEHDRQSHKDYDPEFTCWTISIITHADYNTLNRVSKTSAFWKAIRQSPKQIKPLFSGLTVGSQVLMLTK